jgi:hypothetical protein
MLEDLTQTLRGGQCQDRVVDLVIDLAVPLREVNDLVGQICLIEHTESTRHLAASGVGSRFARSDVGCDIRNPRVEGLTKRD